MGAESAPLIEVEALHKRFGAVVAVDGVSFSVRRGEVLGFLGPNAAGKSTTMRMIAGYLAPLSGRVRVCGRDMAIQPRLGQAQLGYLPEGAPLWPDMTTRQLLRFALSVRGIGGAAAAAACDRAVARAGLDGVLGRPIGTLSKGFRRRAGLAQAIVHDPPVLVLDEPTDGLDPNQKRHTRRLIADMAMDKAVIVSTHILEEVEAMCTRAVVIDRGRLVADGTPAALMATSRYCGAVTAVLATAHLARARRVLEALPGVMDTGVDIRGADALLTLFVAARAGAVSDNADAGAAALLDKVARLAHENGWRLSGLARERGRLEDVFAKLTRHAPPDPSAPTDAPAP